jgi:hypothetical protein
MVSDVRRHGYLRMAIAAAEDARHLDSLAARLLESLVNATTQERCSL